MAEALLGIVRDNLLSVIRNEYATMSGIKEKAERLSSTLALIKAVLEDAEKQRAIEDAEQKQITNSSVKVWLQEVKDAAYVLDDILDECSIHSNRLGGLSSLKPKNIMLWVLSSLNPKNIKLRHEIGTKLKEIAERFAQIAEDKKILNLQEGAKRERPSEVAEWRQTGPIIAQPRVYGRDEDKDKILEFLLTQAKDCDFLPTYPIVGLGGVGKTTLAQLIYNDDRVSSHFNMKIWVCVSEHFSVKRILCSIIESLVTEKKYGDFALAVIQRKVQELLQGKRYLLVLDDVWKVSDEFESGLSHEKWNNLNMCPRLSNVYIFECPRLLELSCLPSGNLTSLDLRGGGDKKMTCFPEGMMTNLTSLKTLHIMGFDELKELPDELFLYLHALETLCIFWCPTLECLPEGGWEGLCSLRHLTFWGCPNLKWLPEGVRHLTSLEVLDIRGCGALTDD